MAAITKMPNDTRKRKKRWFVIGPGIILAAVVALQIVISERKTDATPPIIERNVTGIVISNENIPVDGIDLILKIGNKLALSSGQVDSLSELRWEWKQKSTPLETRMSDASEKFHDYMAEHTSGKIPLSEIQSRTALVSSISGQVASLRKVYWQKAMMILNAGQKNKLKNEINTGAQDAARSYNLKRGTK